VSVLGLVSIGSPDEEVAAALEQGLREAFGLSVRRFDPLPEPPGALDPARGQWASTAFLRLLLGSLPPGTGRLLGLTPRDLFVPVLSFVFGQAQLNGPVAVVSVARLDQTFHGLPADRPLLVTRALKEAVHELGHTFGLIHCADSRCPMSLSIDIRQLDAKTSRFCASCAILLKESPEMRNEQRPSRQAAGVRP
jgi:archaemetzincin